MDVPHVQDGRVEFVGVPRGVGIENAAGILLDFARRRVALKAGLTTSPLLDLMRCNTLVEACGNEMKRASCQLLAGAFLFAASLAHATTINYFTTSLGGTDWRYDYTVSNDTLGMNLQEFTIYFDVNLFSNLAVLSSPADWDSLVVQPDLALPSNGFFDSLALFGGLTPGTSVGGFSVTFMFAGAGGPGSQAFDIVDPQTFAVLESGVTSRFVEPPSTVAEPNALPLLLLAGVFAAAGARLRATS